MKAHNLKLDDKYFDDVKFGKKKYEITKNNIHVETDNIDIDFQAGDVIYFHRYHDGYLKTIKSFAGLSKGTERTTEHDADVTVKKVEYIETTGIKDGYVMLYLSPMEE